MCGAVFDIQGCCFYEGQYGEKPAVRTEMRAKKQQNRTMTCFLRQLIKKMRRR